MKAKIYFSFFLVFFLKSILIKSETECATNKYPKDNSTLVPTYTLNLNKPPEERWKEIVIRYKQQLVDLFDYFYLNQPQYEQYMNYNGDNLGNLLNSFPEPYKSEIIGMSNATNISVKNFMLFNVFYEASSLCSSIVVEDKNGNIFHARNLDFGLLLGWDFKNDTWATTQLLRKLTINVDVFKDEKLLYKITTFAGFVGVLTGLKPKEYSVTINQRKDMIPGFAGIFKWFARLNRNDSWVTLLAREVFEKNIQFKEVVSILSFKYLLAPVYYIVAGPDNIEGSISTRNQTSLLDLWKLGSNETWFIAITNYDRTEKQPTIDDRITPINDCMNQFGRNLTIHTTLIEVLSGQYESYIQDCRNPCALF